MPAATRRRIKDWLLDLAREPPRLDLLHGNPWSSPNVWEACVAAYKGRSHPAVFEYGSGFSTIGHARALMDAGGGLLSSVEHDPVWWIEVCGAVQKLALTESWSLECAYQPPGDLSAMLRGPGIVQVNLKCRSPLKGWVGGEGNAEWFAEYIQASSGGRYDLIEVDGRARVACVHHVLDNALLKPGGSLALMEAGRGTEKWLGRPTLTDDADYQPAVARMRSCGARMIDGVGLYSWPRLVRGFGLRQPNRPIPMECCLMVNHE